MGGIASCRSPIALPLGLIIKQRARDTGGVDLPRRPDDQRVIHLQVALARRDLDRFEADRFGVVLILELLKVLLEIILEFSSVHLQVLQSLFGAADVAVLL